MKARRQTPERRLKIATPAKVRSLPKPKTNCAGCADWAARFLAFEQRFFEVEQELKALRQSHRETEEFLQGQIRLLEKGVKDRDEKLEDAYSQIDWFQREYFTSNSEKVEPKQESNNEETAEGKPDPPEDGEKKPRGQQKGSKGHPRSDRSGVDTDEEFLKIPGCACSKCGKAYRKLETTKTSQLLEIQVRLLLTEYHRHSYVSQCQCEGKKIVTAPPPPKLYPRCNIGSSLWVHLIVQKFLHQVPTNRTLKDLNLSGLPLSQGTVTGGFQRIDSLLAPLYQGLVNHCRGADIWNADETSWRVFGSGKKKWWLWVVASHDAVVYILDPSRSKAVPTSFFGGSSGVLMTDRFSSYKALHEAIRKAWCWVHVRRDFFNLFMGVPVLKVWSKEWLEEIALLFVLEHKRFQLWKDGKDFGPAWQECQEELAKHVKKLENRWKEQLKQPKLHKKQKTVLTSLKNHWEGLTIFLEDPRIPLHNNRAERLIRNAVILRKNSYGSGAEWSGHLATKLFSILQTWLINGLDPQAMLQAYFDECSKTPGRPPPDVGDFLPWKMSEERKSLFPLPTSYKRPG